MGVGGHQAPAIFTPRKDPVPIVQEAGWAPGQVWIRAENLTPPGFGPQNVQPVAVAIPTTLPGPLVVVVVIIIIIK